MGSKAGQKLGVVRKTEKLGERERKALFPSEGKGHDDDDDDDVFKLKIGTLVHKLQYRKKDIPPALYGLAQPASAVHNYN